MDITRWALGGISVGIWVRISSVGLGLLIAADAQAVAPRHKEPLGRGRVPASLLPGKPDLKAVGPGLSAVRTESRTGKGRQPASEPGTLAGGRIRFGYSWQK